MELGRDSGGGVNVKLQLEAKQSPNFPVHLRPIPIEERPYDRFVDGVTELDFSLFYHVAGLTLEPELALVEVAQPMFPNETE